MSPGGPSPSSAGESRPRIVIADEQPTVRASIARLLDRNGLMVCGEAADAAEAVAIALRERPDACVLDVMLPGDGIGAIGEISAAQPATAVVVLTDCRDQGQLFRALQAGAAGYLLKDMNPERLPAAIRGVLAGEAAIPRALVTLLVNELRSRGRRQLVVTDAGRTELTAREWDVAELLLEGASTERIAERLMISPVTVRRHLSSILSKLGATDRATAVKILAAPWGPPRAAR